MASREGVRPRSPLVDEVAARVLAPEEDGQVERRYPLEKLGGEVLLPSEYARLVTRALVHERTDEAPDCPEDERRVDDEHLLDALRVVVAEDAVEGLAGGASHSSKYSGHIVSIARWRQ